MKEASIENDILQYLQYRGFVAWRTHDARHKPCTPGVPDIMGVKDGHLIAVEVKRPGCKTTQAQDEFLETLRGAGGKAFVAHDLREVQEALCE